MSNEHSTPPKMRAHLFAYVDDDPVPWYEGMLMSDNAGLDRAFAMLRHWYGGRGFITINHMPPRYHR